jgi:hypothetical protein
LEQKHATEREQDRLFGLSFTFVGRRRLGGLHMRTTTRIGSLLLAAAAIFVSGCGGPQNGTGAFQGAATRGIRARLTAMTLQRARYHGASWAKPNSAAQPSLLYVTNLDGTIPFFAYQNGNGLSLQGTLAGDGAAGQPCVDQSGDIFIPDYQSSVIEYAHGGTVPLHVFQTGGYPLACSIDKLTGNLAVPINSGVLVFPGASPTGTPTFYANSPSLGDSFFCAYDSHGNLFVDGTGTQEFTLAVLPHNSATMQDVTVTGGTVLEPGNLLWIGTKLSVVDFGETAESFDLFHVSGTHATMLSSTYIPVDSGVGSWKAGSHANAKMIFADGLNGATLFTYPALTPYGSATSGVTNAFGVAVSKHP